jgi:ribosomal protein S18 acetylase RimI-like enzyme
MSAAFRAATSADVPAVLAHQREYYATDGYTFDEAAARAALDGLLAEGMRGRLWVLADGDQVVGYLAVTFGWSLEYQGRDAFVDELYVAASHRGRGLGRMAMTLAEDACRAAGVRALHLEVERANTRARALYERTGFVDHERLLMTRRLTPIR